MQESVHQLSSVSSKRAHKNRSLCQLSFHGLRLRLLRERYYRGDTDVPKTPDSERGLSLGDLVEDYRRLKPVDAKPEVYVFQDHGETLDDRDILKNYIRPAAKKLGFYFPGFGWHSFRRQHVTRIQEEDATVAEAQVQAGHARPSLTREYTILTEERRAEAVKLLQKRLLPNGLD